MRRLMSATALLIAAISTGAYAQSPAEHADELLAPHTGMGMGIGMMRGPMQPSQTQPGQMQQAPR